MKRVFLFRLPNDIGKLMALAAQIRELDLQYPADMDRELLVDPPYDDLYPLYLQACLYV